jgi:aminotransferase
VTGWRVGYIIGPAALTGAVRKVHDFLTVGAPAPMQAAGAVAMRFPDTYYTELARAYRERRDYIIEALRRANFRPFVPHGAYYVMCDISGFAFTDDIQFAQFLVRDVGLAVVPGSSFYSRPELGAQQVRFAFPKRMETLARAAERLDALPESIAARQPAGAP